MFRNETNYVLTNGVLLDGTEKMTPQTGRDIYIEGGRIGAVADAAARREGYEVVDLGGQYVLPGLINLHDFSGNCPPGAERGPHILPGPWSS